MSSSVLSHFPVIHNHSSSNLLLESSCLAEEDNQELFLMTAVDHSLPFWKRLAIGIHDDHVLGWPVIGGSFLLFVVGCFALFLGKNYQKRGRQQLDSSSSSHHRRRRRADSMNLMRSFLQQQQHDDDPHEDDPWDPSQRMPHSLACRFQYPGGPAQQTIRYETMVPPPTWTEASRRLLPPNKIWNLQQPVVLQVPQRTMAFEDGRTLDVDQIGIHVVTPVESGVLELYQKGAPREEWKEHTFPSAAMAAQFQADLLALQFVGAPLLALYDALELVHRGSMAYEGKEVVLHDASIHLPPPSDPTAIPSISTEPSGICWDDAMRCLGMHHSAIRLRLEALRWVRGSGPGKSGVSTAPVDPKDEASSRLKPEYVGKRMLLGVVDFFRLFVPIVKETATPHSSVSRERMEGLLLLRKQVAQAARLVQVYVEARKVANLGWKLEKRPIEPYWKKRLACDENQENVRHDVNAKNEYYEPTVARDVLCPVRTKEHLKASRWWHLGLSGVAPLSSSQYQGYALVGMHSFRWDPSWSDYPLQPNLDPVAAIPSLKNLVQKHPSHHFFVHVYFAEGRRCIANVQVFVRSLPEGIDTTFDRNVDRFVRGSAEGRRQRLECALQLGIDQQRLSWLARLMLSFLSFMMRITHRRRTSLAASSYSRKRSTIPPINLSECGDTYHFGGALQQESKMPSNYIACSTHLKSRRQNTLLARFLISYMECDGFSNDVTDFTYLIAGVQSDEVPERALGSIRTVSYKLDDCSLPLDYITDNNILLDKYRANENFERKTSAIGTLFSVLLVDPILEAFQSPGAKREREHALVHQQPDELSLSESFHTTSNYTETSRTGNLLENAISEVIECLRNVTIPVRKNDCLYPDDSSDGFLQKPILQILSRDDIRRYLIGSDGSVKFAAVRIVQSTSWRYLTFPINTKACRVELQSGQFFHQGKDLEGNPVFYFRNICLGPWRKNEDATIAAVLHRLDASLNSFAKTNPRFQCTVVIIAGIRRKRHSDGCDAAGENLSMKDDDESTVNGENNDLADYNPRVHHNAEKCCSGPRPECHDQNRSQWNSGSVSCDQVSPNQR
ncbi:hypothetical protein FisN_12Hh083 [Fistulifera solaris]|uniref:Uncharacterized protein n=1 Tax=Fistulifera solaris TaxID=1519565 RepID=A0A1Z5KQJ1_FISSO|nr:hypothetical protein FisN_12Hh083 [Fistulifera solaris]|eukprot:GAX28549.1 hypothetical protein FisN_12Hh083 [Fistulifera solaris]